MKFGQTQLYEIQIMMAVCLLTRQHITVYSIISFFFAVVPLRTLVHTSPVFLAANAASLTEGSIVKSLRAHATDTFDTQMIVLDKSRPRGSRHGYAPAGGYQVRRKDWVEVTRRFPTFSPEYWDIRTIYIVRTF